MKVRVKYYLDLPIDEVWNRLKLVSTLLYVAKPIVKFQAINPKVFPGEWSIGNYETSILLFGWIPFGRHHIVIQIPETADLDKMILIDNGYGSMIKIWKHTITIVKKSDLQTTYQDEVIIQAGVLTPFVWMFAWIFYRWRRRNWFKLIQSTQ